MEIGDNYIKKAEVAAASAALTKRKKGDKPLNQPKVIGKDEWLKLFELYQLINTEIRQRKKLFDKSDVEKLRSSVDEFHFRTNTNQRDPELQI